MHVSSSPVLTVKCASTQPWNLGDILGIFSLIFKINHSYVHASLPLKYCIHTPYCTKVPSLVQGVIVSHVLLHYFNLLIDLSNCFNALLQTVLCIKISNILLIGIFFSYLNNTVTTLLKLWLREVFHHNHPVYAYNAENRALVNKVGELSWILTLKFTC